MSRVVVNKPHFEDYMVENLVMRSEKRGSMQTAFELRDAVEKYIFANTLSGLIAESAVWSEETFPQSTMKSIATHLAREAEELKNNPGDAMEMADIMLLLGHLVAITGTNLVDAGYKKLEINRQREWGKVDAEGVVEHVREDSWVDAATSETEGPKAISIIVNGKVVFEGVVNELREVLVERKKVWVPPVYPILEIGEDGRQTGRYAIYLEANTGEISWSKTDAYHFMSPDSTQAKYVRYLRSNDKAYN